MNLRTASNGGVAGSPTSDYVDEGSCCSTGEPAASDSSGCSSSGRSPASPASVVVTHTTATHATHGAAVAATVAAMAAARHKHPQHVPYDPLVHVTSKPPYSFSCLIFMAIEDSPGHALPVKEIYAWILDHFPYFKNAPTGWKNSVRHNLSLNKCFRKVEKAPNLGKGSLWMVDPMYRPNLVQALAKSPFHPYSTIGSRPASLSSGVGSSSATSTPTKAPSSPNRSVRQQTPPAAGGTSGGGSANNSVNVPDPTLFPFLSRRLAQSTPGASSPPPAVQREDSLDDVDAAAAMLALKHAHLRVPQKDDWYKRLREETSEAVGLRKKMKMRVRTPQEIERMVITTSPSEDHTYSAALNLSARSTAAVSTTPATHAPPSTTSSPDEAFEEGSDSDDGTPSRNSRPLRAASAESAHTATSPLHGHHHYHHHNHHSNHQGDTSDEERRKIAEGADALLNLAGIRTDGGRVLSPPLPPAPARVPSPRGQAATPRPTQSPAPAGPRGRRRRKPPPPSSRAVATHKHHRDGRRVGSTASVTPTRR